MNPKDILTGLEFEFFVIDSSGLPYSEAYNLAESCDHPGIKGEFGPYQLELSTSPHTSLFELELEARDIFAYARDLFPKDVIFLPIGAYPFSFQPQVSPNDRLESIVRETNKTYGFRSGLGVEVETGLQACQMNFSLLGGDESGESLVRIHNFLRPLIPISVTLSSNSPYYLGKRICEGHTLHNIFGNETNGSLGLLDGRREVWELCEGRGTTNEIGGRLGIPESYGSFENYRSFLDDLPVMGDASLTNPESTMYGDIRIRTEDKSCGLIPLEEQRVEFRPCDILPTLKENLGLTAFLKGCLVYGLDGGEHIFPKDSNGIRTLLDSCQRKGFNFFYNSCLMEDVFLDLLGSARNCLGSESVYLNELNTIIQGNLRSVEQISKGSRRFVRDIVQEGFLYE